MPSCVFTKKSQFGRPFQLFLNILFNVERDSLAHFADFRSGPVQFISICHLLCVCCGLLHKFKKERRARFRFVSSGEDRTRRFGLCRQEEQEDGEVVVARATITTAFCVGSTRIEDWEGAAWPALPKSNDTPWLIPSAGFGRKLRT